MLRLDDALQKIELDARRLVQSPRCGHHRHKREHGQRRLSMATPTKKSAASATDMPLKSELGSDIAAEHVIESLQREFWTDEHLHVLRTVQSKRQIAIKTLSGRFFHGQGHALPMVPDELVHLRKISLCKDCTARFRERLFIEHEWVSPLRVTVEERTTPAARIMLLVIVVISQMVVEALLYDLRYLCRGGTQYRKL